MKKCIIAVLSLLVLLMSCATIPEPENADDSLVIGRVVLDFPDGYLGKPARTVDSNVTVKIVNLTTREEYTRRTDNGYYYIPASPGDEIQIGDYYYTTTSGRYSTSLNGGIRRKVKVEGNKIIYFGDLTVTYREGKVVSKDGRSSSYSYDMDYNLSDNPDNALNYLESELAESAWLDKSIISVKMYK